MGQQFVRKILQLCILLHLSWSATSRTSSRFAPTSIPLLFPQDKINEHYPRNSPVHMMCWMNFWTALTYALYLFGFSRFVLASSCELCLADQKEGPALVCAPHIHLSCLVPSSIHVCPPPNPHTQCRLRFDILPPAPP